MYQSLFFQSRKQAGTCPALPLTWAGLVSSLVGSVVWITASAAFATTLTVTSANDTGPGTLRQAIIDAAGGDTIVFALPANSQIVLGSTLAINKNLTINGPGANLLSVQRNAAQATPPFRVFDIQAPMVTAINVSLSGLTISNGDTIDGGGIRSLVVNLFVSQCAIVGNSAGTGRGGGIYSAAPGGSLTVVNSTISGNSASDGGGIYAGNATSVTSSTLSGNHLTGNSGGGGGISVGNGVTSISSSTIARNTGVVYGGGISNGSPNAVILQNSIVALNTSFNQPDLSGSFTSHGYNLIGISTSGTIPPTTGDKIGTSASAIDPVLGPLADNGGPTMTLALLSGSPAIDAGYSFGALLDQRGLTRPVDSPVITNASGGDGNDIGAYEVQADLLPDCSTKIHVVSTTVDAGQGSLRDIIGQVCAGTTITFAAGLGPVTLTSGELFVGRSMTISGSGANAVTVQRSSATVPVTPNFRVFRVPANVIVTLRGITITNGLTPGSTGGGILNNGNLTLDGVVVTGNLAPSAGNGGGIFNSGTLTVVRSTISNNSVSSSVGAGSGGGIFNFGATLTLNNSTVSGNSAVGPGGTSDSGGGIFTNLGVVNVINSTITNNTGDLGGGIRNPNGGTVNMRSSIIAFNTSTPAPDIGGMATSQGFNIIGDRTGVTITPAQFTDQIGNILPSQVLLGALQNNGGATPTHSLAAGSIAIDKGDSGGASMDQRGAARIVNDPAITNAGDGADVGAFEFGPAGIDIDGNHSYDALTDGLLIIRYMFGLTGAALTNGAIGPSPVRSTPVDIKLYLDNIRPSLDVDNNGQVDALTDGLLILRYMFGLRGASLTASALGSGAARNAAQIETYIQSLMP